MTADSKHTDRQRHWEHLYDTKGNQDLSWFQPHPELSLKLIESVGLNRDDAIIDIGGGTSKLIDLLLQTGYTNLTVLDIAKNALEQSQLRLAEQASKVKWIAADITKGIGQGSYRLWHDRAVFHFLVDPVERGDYLEVMQGSLLPDSHIIIATFSPDGPEQCSGLPVQRYNPEDLAQALGPGYRLLNHHVEAHQTPAGKQQEFIYCLFQRKSG